MSVIMRQNAFSCKDSQLARPDIGIVAQNFSDWRNRRASLPVKISFCKSFAFALTDEKSNVME
jgi:hypothetical protein